VIIEQYLTRNTGLTEAINTNRSAVPEEVHIPTDNEDGSSDIIILTG
jgi:hypothetical protein